MKHMLIIFVLILTILGCDSSIKQEHKEKSSSAGEVVDDAQSLVAADAVKGGEVVKKIVVEDPVIETLPAKDTLSDLSRFTHKRFKNDTIISWKRGDINNDNVDDFVVVLQSKEEDLGITGMSDTYERKVILLETIKEYPNFKLRGVNEEIIGCSTCGGAGVGDPFGSRGIAIKDNYFSIEELYGACTKSFIVTTYKYDVDRDKWFLHKIGEDTYSCREEDNPGDEINVDHEEETTKDFGEVPFSKDN